MSKKEDISAKFNHLHMSKKEDISAKLKPHNIKKDNICVNKIITIIKENLNHFEITDSSHLYNIANGRSACQNTERFLLNIFKIGYEERIQFISECIECLDIFEKVIKRQKLHTFVTEAGMKNNWKVWEIRRNVFGSWSIWEYSFFYRYIEGSIWQKYWNILPLKRVPRQS